ncbi:MAG: hypothetical protein ACFFD6_01425 [Candidatus Thorarchaeota archaeon]
MAIESNPIESSDLLNENREADTRESKREHRSFRILNIKIIVPRRIKRDSNEDLILMLSSLRNAIAICSVYISRIEREHQRRASVSHMAL